MSVHTLIFSDHIAEKKPKTKVCNLILLCVVFLPPDCVNIPFSQG